MSDCDSPPSGCRLWSPRRPAPGSWRWGQSSGTVAVPRPRPARPVPWSPGPPLASHGPPARGCPAPSTKVWVCVCVYYSMCFFVCGNVCVRASAHDFRISLSPTCPTLVAGDDDLQASQLSASPNKTEDDDWFFILGSDQPQTFFSPGSQSGTMWTIIEVLAQLTKSNLSSALLENYVL